MEKLALNSSESPIRGHEEVGGRHHGLSTERLVQDHEHWDVYRLVEARHQSPDHGNVWHATHEKREKLMPQVCHDTAGRKESVLGKSCDAAKQIGQPVLGKPIVIAGLAVKS